MSRADDSNDTMYWDEECGEWKDKKPQSRLGVCPVCGKEFFIPVMGMWTYKKQDNYRNDWKYFCGWNCMRKFEKAYEEKKKKSREAARKKRTEVYRR